MTYIKRLSLVMSLRKGQYNYLYVLIAFVLVGLIGIQLYWINKTIAVEKNAIKRSLNSDFEKLARQAEEYASCYILRAKTYINKGEGIYLVKQKVDSNGNYIGPEQGGFIDTVNLFNFHIVNGDTILENYPSLELRRFASSLDATFNFAIEGVRDPASYAFDKLTSENLKQAFDNTIDIENAIGRNYLDAQIKEVLRRNELDTNYSAGVKKQGAGAFLILTDSLRQPYSYRDVLEVPLFANEVTEPYLLVIGLPQPFAKVIRSLSVMLISSVVIILILILSYAYFVRTIINQRKLSEMKNAFINNMTHEFRTPITNIGLAIENWRDTGKNPDFYYNIIEEENRHMEKNVNQILELATMKHKDNGVAYEPVDMHELTRKAIESFNMQVKSVNGQLVFEPGAHTHHIYGNEREMYNMVLNLVDNAVKYRSANPEIHVSTYDEGTWLVIEVRDNGIGMTAETQEHIFERFYRSDTGDRHDVKGFGLGLSYVKYIVDCHGGTILVKSKPGYGSTFTIRLPKNNKT